MNRYSVLKMMHAMRAPRVYFLRGSKLVQSGDEYVARWKEWIMHGLRSVSQRHDVEQVIMVSSLSGPEESGRATNGKVDF